MLKFGKITTLLSFLLLSTLVTSCGCGDKKEQERKKFVAEEKELTDKLKAQLKKEDDQNNLMEFEEFIKSIKDKKVKIEEVIKDLKDYSAKLDKIETLNLNVLSKDNIKDLFLFGKTVGSLKETYLPKEIEDLGLKLEKISSDRTKTKEEIEGLTNECINNFFATPEKAISLLQQLLSPNNIAKVKQHISDSLKLFENLKKQAELKKGGTKK